MKGVGWLLDGWMDEFVSRQGEREMYRSDRQMLNDRLGGREGSVLDIIGKRGRGEWILYTHTEYGRVYEGGRIKESSGR